MSDRLQKDVGYWTGALRATLIHLPEEAVKVEDRIDSVIEAYKEYMQECLLKMRADPRSKERNEEKISTFHHRIVDHERLPAAMEDLLIGQSITALASPSHSVKPADVAKRFEKPHYTSSLEKARIFLSAASSDPPNYLHHEVRKALQRAFISQITKTMQKHGVQHNSDEYQNTLIGNLSDWLEEQF